MPHKPLQPLASSHWADQFYFIVSPYYKSLDMATTEENKDEKKEAIKRTKRLEARVTEKEYAKVVELAETCGLTLSDYIRKCALRQHPRR